MIRVVKTSWPGTAPGASVDVKVDVLARLPGRGAYVHADAGCVEQATRKGGLARTLRAAVPSSVRSELAAIAAIRTGADGAPAMMADGTTRTAPQDTTDATDTTPYSGRRDAHGRTRQ